MDEPDDLICHGPCLRTVRASSARRLSKRYTDRRTMGRQAGLAGVAAIASWPLWMVITTTFFPINDWGRIGAADVAVGSLLTFVAVLASVLVGRLLSGTRLWRHWNARAIWAVILVGAGVALFLQTFMPLLGASRSANLVEGAAYALAGFALVFAVANWPEGTTTRGGHAV